MILILKIIWIIYDRSQTCWTLRTADTLVIDDVFQVMGIGKQVLEMLVDDVEKRGYAFVGGTVKSINVLVREVVAWLCKNGFSETDFGTSISVALALKIFEKGQDLNLIKRLD